MVKFERAPLAKRLSGPQRNVLVVIIASIAISLIYVEREKKVWQNKIQASLSRTEDMSTSDRFWCYEDGLPWSQAELVEDIFSFAELYDQRPLGRKIGGMGFDHSYYLWYTLRKLQPKFIVENGIFEGHTTWLIKKACPNAQLISLDPRPSLPQRFDGVTYFIGKNFSDFNTISWSKYDFSPENSFVLFDDHQSGMRRSLEAYSHGFGHIMFDDNYFGAGGDNYSLRKICDLNFSVPFTDSFNTVKKELSDRTRKAHNRLMRQLIKGYHEYPPIVTTKVSGSTRFSDDQAKPALLSRDTEVKRLLSMVPLEFLKAYTYICYAKLNNH